VNQYRTLDNQTEGPDVTGPTRDHNQVAKNETVYRQEWSYNVRPGRLPVSLMAKARPQTSATPISGLAPGRLPVLVRNSNMNPAASGSGDMNSTWRVSDPYWANTAEGRAMSGLGAAPAPPLAQLGPSPFTKYFLLLGIGAGVLGYFVYRHAK
jgi:hypothetical protein